MHTYRCICIVCLYMYVCICMHVYVCMYMYVCVCVYMYVCMYVCICMHVCKILCMYMCVCIHVYVCMHNIWGNCPWGNVLPKTGGGIVRGELSYTHSTQLFLINGL